MKPRVQGRFQVDVAPRTVRLEILDLSLGDESGKGARTPQVSGLGLGAQRGKDPGRLETLKVGFKGKILFLQ